LTSCQSENSEFVGRALTRYFGERLGIRVEFVDDIPWEERERLLDAGVETGAHQRTLRMIVRGEVDA